MKNIKSRHFNLTLTLVLMMFGSHTAMGQTVPYNTSFEAPVYSVGPIAGQDGWTGNGTVQNESSYIKSGTQSLMVNGNGQVSHYFVDVPTGSIFIDGYYHESAVDMIPDVTSLETGSSFVLFHKTQGILALDGNRDGGGTWVVTGVQVATDTLQRITIAQDFDDKVWVLYIDEQAVSYQGQTPYHFGFRDGDLESFCGVDIDSASSGASYTDDFSVSFNWPAFLLKQTPPNVLVYSFLQEWFDNEEDNGGLTWDLTSGDGETSKVNASDLIELLQDFSPGDDLLKVAH